MLRTHKALPTPLWKDYYTYTHLKGSLGDGWCSPTQTSPVSWFASINSRRTPPGSSKYRGILKGEDSTGRDSGTCRKDISFYILGLISSQAFVETNSRFTLNFIYREFSSINTFIQTYILEWRHFNFQICLRENHQLIRLQYRVRDGTRRVYHRVYHLSMYCTSCFYKGEDHSQDIHIT